MRFACPKDSLRWFQSILLCSLILGIFIPVCAQDIRLTNNNYGEYHLAWSPDGSTISSPNDPTGNPEILLVSFPEGNVSAIPMGNLQGDYYMSWFDDATICFDAYGANQQMNLYTLNTITQNIDHLTYYQSHCPAVSSDGEYLTYSTLDHISQIPVGGGVGLPVVDGDGHVVIHQKYSFNDQFLVYTRFIDNNSDIWMLDIASGDVTQLTNEPGMDDQACWCPDNESIVFVSDRAAERDIYKLNTITMETELLIDRDGPLGYPVYSPDGNYLAYTWEQEGLTEIWYRDFTVSTSQAMDDRSGMKVFPNPSKSGWHVSWDLPESAEVTLTMYSMSVSQFDLYLPLMKDEPMEGGSHLRKIHPGNPGIYVLILSYGDIRESKKLVAL
jgi:Tol biopolymer transport system component